MAWNDPTLALPWLDSDPVVSARDAGNPAVRMGSDPVVCVTGAGGQVGLALREHLPDARFLTRDQLDVTDAGAVRSALGGVDLVIHCAAMTDVDGCEREPERAAAVNASAAATRGRRPPTA